MNEDDLQIKNSEKKKEYVNPMLPKHIQAFSPEIMNEEKHEKRITELTVSDMLHDILSKKRVRYSIYIILFFVLINFWFFRYDDWWNGCHIGIQFSLLEFNNLEIKKAINFIKDKSPEDYKKVCRYVDRVSLFLPCDFSYGGCFYDSKPREIGVYSFPRDKRGDPSFTAAVIYHEACHAIQKEENRVEGDREAECYRNSYRFLRGAGVPDDEIPINWKVYNQSQ